MMKFFLIPGAARTNRLRIALALALCFAPALFAQPKISSIVPPAGGVDLTNPITHVTINGAGFFATGAATPAPDLALAFDPSTAVASYHIDSVTSDGIMNATLAMASTAQGIISVTPTANQKTGAAFMWDTGIAVNACLETIQATGCQLRWEVDASGVSGSSSQTNTNNSGNFLVTLDYQVAKNKDSKTKNSLNGKPSTPDTPHGARSFADRLGVHLIFKTGYTQVSTSNTIAPATTSSPGSTPPATSSTPACSGVSGSASGSSTPVTCVAATPQNAFIADAKITTDWTLGQNGQTAYSAVGLAARGSLESLVQSNQIIQSGGLPYADLTSVNPKNLVGIYEGVFRYRLSQPSHDRAPNSTTAAYENVSDLLVIEAGAQYDSGLTQLAPNPQTNTRNRIVGRFYAYPELPNANHTKILVGLEVSAGINGGPKVVQIFWGANLNPTKLFSH
jgi:hypothetical protein